MPALVRFASSNESTVQLAKHLLRHRTASQGTLNQYLYGVYRYCKWLNTQPDQLIRNCTDQDGDANPKAIAKCNRLLGDFVGELQAEDLAPGTGVKELFGDPETLNMVGSAERKQAANRDFKQTPRRSLT